MIKFHHPYTSKSKTHLENEGPVAEDDMRLACHCMDGLTLSNGGVRHP